MSDVNFMNSYNEIVFDNFIAVLKQNLMFQTQLKLVEPKLARIPELEKQVADSSTALQELERTRSTVQSLTNELSGKNAQIQQHSSSDADHHRIQTALNEKMRECETLRASVDSLNRELQSLTSQAKQKSDAITMNATLVSQKKTLEDTLASQKKMFDDTIQKQTEYIRKLEDLLPITKRKKLGLPVPDAAINIAETLIPVASSGGIF
jgi:chromosome segregation ATPase